MIAHMICSLTVGIHGTMGSVGHVVHRGLQTRGKGRGAPMVFAVHRACYCVHSRGRGRIMTKAVLVLGIL